jgi:diguanylate cyclase (GGDEF)-like protein
MATTSSLRARLTLVAAGIALFMVGVTAGLGYVITDLTGATRDVERLASRIAVMDRLQLELAGLLAPVNDYLLTEDVSRRDAFDRSVLEISRLLSGLQRDQADPEWHAAARDIHEGVTHLGTLAVEVLFVEHPVGNPEVIRVMNTVHRLAEDVNAKAARFRALVEVELTDRRQRAASRSAAATRVFIVLAIAVSITLAIGYALLTRWVMGPLASLARGVGGLTPEGETRLPVHGHDEIARVSRAFNELADRMTVSQEEAQRRSLQLEALNAAGRAFRQENSRDEVYRTLTAFACSVTDAQYGVAAVLNDHDQVVHMIESGVAPGPDQTPDERQAFISALPAGHRPLRIQAGEHEARLQGLPGAGAVRALMTVPVVAEAGARSQLYLFDPGHGAFSDADEDLVVKITHDAAQALRLVALREEAARLATVDGLTGFMNRRAFEDRLADEFLLAARHGRPFALVFIDVDDLKAINEKGGHSAGDAAIRRFCDAIRSVTRATDVTGRYGGDEMLVLFPETTLKDAMAAANRILRRITSLPLTVAQERITLSASLGVAAYPEHGRDKESLLRAADFALYQAKATGRGSVHTVKPSEGDPSSASKAA